MFCAQCGLEVANDAGLCGRCGKVLAAQPTKKESRAWLWFLVVAAVILVAIIEANSSRPVSPSQPTITSPNETISTGNLANDKLLAMTSAEQAHYLGIVVQGDCVGSTAFYMGQYKADGSVFWSVRCTNGDSYAVQIEADSVGTTKILECSMLKLVAHTSCFQRLSEQ